MCPFHRGDQDIYRTEDGSVGFQKVSAPLGVSWHNMGLVAAPTETDGWYWHANHLHLGPCHFYMAMPKPIQYKCYIPSFGSREVLQETTGFEWRNAFLSCRFSNLWMGALCRGELLHPSFSKNSQVNPVTDYHLALKYHLRIRML